MKRRRPRPARLQRATTAGALLVALLASQVVLAQTAAAAAQVTITSPANGASVWDAVEIDASASTDVAGDAPASLSFQVDGSEIGSWGCDGTSAQCDGSQMWDTYNQPGQRTITVVMTTNNGDSATTSISVTVAPPPGPTVSFTSPDEGATVSGEHVTLAATATSGSSDDPMFELAFCLDSCSKNIIDSYECNGTATCDGSIDWNARYVHGDHTLVVRARQESYLSATDSIHATVTESAKLFAQGPWSGVRGKTTRIKGSLMDGNHPLPNAPLIATIDPAIGRTTQKSLSTNRKGYFTFASKLKTNSVVTFRTKDGSNIKADPFSAKVSIAAVAACSLAQNPIGAGHHDALTCRLPNLPAGVSVRLLGISEHPIHGTSKAGFAIIGFRVPSGVSGDAGVSMIIDANKVYAESGGGATLHIR